MLLPVWTYLYSSTSDQPPPLPGLHLRQQLAAPCSDIGFVASHGTEVIRPLSRPLCLLFTYPSHFTHFTRHCYQTFPKWFCLCCSDCYNARVACAYLIFLHHFHDRGVNSLFFLCLGPIHFLDHSIKIPLDPFPGLCLYFCLPWTYSLWCLLRSLCLFAQIDSSLFWRLVFHYP